LRIHTVLAPSSGGMMSFLHTTYTTRFLSHRQATGAPLQPDPKYGVQLQFATVPATGACWRVVGVHHLTPEENGSRHHALVEVLNETGQRVRNANLKIGWTWEGRTEPDLTAPLDKPAQEPAGNVPIEKGMRLALWLTGDGLPSDRVANLHFEHPDERTAQGEIWNSYGHHSFYIVFQRMVKGQNEGGLDSLVEPRRLPSVPPIPNLYTNQQLINAFFYTAQTLSVSGDELMRKVGVDLAQLAADAATRQALYRGVPLLELPNLTAGEQRLLANFLLRELRATRLWQGQVNAPAGLNLRDRPATLDSTVITALSHGVPLDVVQEHDGWLFVVVDAERAGFVASQFVHPLPTAPDGDPVGLPTRRPPAATFLGADPALLQTPLAPPTAAQLRLGATAGPGAKKLAEIWNRYGGLLTVLANRLQIDPAVAVAVLAVESGGAAFAVDGRMIVRFENHLFYDAWGKAHPAHFFQHFDFNRTTNASWLNHRWRPHAQAPFQTMHEPGTQALEWRVLEFAASLDETAAKTSISMGAPQILGRNYARIGYAHVQEMFNAFASDERSQILGLFDYIRTDATLVAALHNQDYGAFALGYNGSGQQERYGNLIRQALEGIQLLHAAPALVDFDPTTADEAVLSTALDADLAFLPMPELPDRLLTVIDAPQGEGETTTDAAPVAPDAELRAIRLKVMAAWAEHMDQGLANNTVMFRQLLNAFMRPYYMTIIMYTLLFLVGIGLFVVAAWLSAGETTRNYFALLFGGLGVATFLAFFISRPLAALEENLLLITRLGMIYNTYWTRLLYLQDNATVQAELEDVTTAAITELDKLTTKRTELAARRSKLGLR